MIKRFFQWPSTHENNLLPWPQMLWAFLWLPFYLTGSLLIWIAVLANSGPSMAKKMWQELKPW